MAASVQQARTRQWLVTGLLALGILLQVGVVQKGVRLDLSRVWNTIGQHGLWRSAHFNQGRNFANYLEFLNETIPADGRVALPPAQVRPRELGRTPYMQFFLAPRRVINCLEANCLQDLSRENTYVLIVEDFPPEAGFEEGSARKMFDENWGVLLPEGVPANEQEAWQSFENWRTIARAAAWETLWLAALALAGFLLAGCLAPNLNLALKLALGYGLGLGGFTLAAAAFSLAGAPLDKVLLLWITGGLLAGSLALAFGLRPGVRAAGIPGTRPALDLWEGAFLALAGVAAVISIGKGYHTTDEILLWGAKGYGIAADQTVLSVTEWGTNTVAYPLHVPTLIAGARLLLDDNLPAGKMAFSGYYLGLCLLSYGFLVQGGVNRRLAVATSLLIATAPLVIRHAVIAYANLALAFYLAGGVLVLSLLFRQDHQGFTAKLARSKAREGTDKGQQERLPKLSGYFALSGLLLAAAAWSRPEGLPLACLTLGLLLALASIKRLWLPARAWAGLVPPLLVYWLFWWVLKAQVYAGKLAKSDLAANALEQALRGNLHAGAALYVLRAFGSTLVDLRAWGVLGIGTLLVLVLMALRPRARQRGWLAALAGLLYTGSILGMYYLTSYDTTHDISWWVNTGLDRMLLPGFILLWIGGVWALAGSKR